jgi:hypothetical protein
VIGILFVIEAAAGIIFSIMRDIALRGVDPNWWLLGGLIAIGLALMLISWQLMRRLIASSQ